MVLSFPPKAEWQTFVLGPWRYPDLRCLTPWLYPNLVCPPPPPPPTDPISVLPENPYYWTFPCLPQVASGHTKVFPPRSTLGPTEPDIDDTLSTANWMDLSGGQGIAIINPATDMGRTWWHTSDARQTDGITNPPEVTKAQPATIIGDRICTPVGTIGTCAYGLWGTHLHRWLPETRSWDVPQQDIGITTGPGVAFNDRMYWPTATGYITIKETSTGVLAAPVPHTGAAHPDYPEDGDTALPSGIPKVWRFGVYDQALYAITTKDDRYTLCFYNPSLVSDDTNPLEEVKGWTWPMATAYTRFVHIDAGVLPHQLIGWVDALGQGPALWAITDSGCLRLDPHQWVWEHTTLWNVPPHPNWGRCAAPFRPGEALWISSGGGDVTQYSASGVVVPASGPGGRGFGMPPERRGDIVSMASDLANLYCLVKGDPILSPTRDIEDTAGADPVYIPASASVTSVIASTGKGWHPLWENTDDLGTDGELIPAAPGVPTEIVVAKTYLPETATWDFTCFWGIGEWAYAMPCRLTSYSAAQGRKLRLDRFQRSSYIELGEFHAGSINAKKLWSHAALKMKYATPSTYAELLYSTDDNEDLTLLGRGTVSNSRIVLPFGLDDVDDPHWSAGQASYWIKPYVRLEGLGGTDTPVLQAFSLSYLPLRQDASHMVFTVPLPVEVDERSGKTAEQIHDQIHHLLHDEVFHHLQFQNTSYRVVISGVSHTEIAGADFVGAIKINVIQVGTGLPGLVGEVVESHG